MPQDSEKPPTLQDIADKAGVTKATVSMALRNHPRISRQTIERVQKIAEELNYRTNPLIAAYMTQLRTNRKSTFTTTIAFLHDHKHQRNIRQSSLPESHVFRGAKKRAYALGYGIEPFSINEPGMTYRRLSDILYNRGIRGVIISLLQETTNVELKWDYFATANIGYTFRPPILNRVCHDHFTATVRTLDRLTQKGYQRIGMVLREVDQHRSGHFWTAAYLNYYNQVVNKGGLPLLIVEERDKTALEKWLNQHKPDVILSGNHFLHNWMSEWGLLEQHATAYVNMSWVPEFSELAGTSHCFAEMGASAVDTVVSALQLNQTGLPDKPKTTLIAGEWKSGESLPKQAPK